MCGIAGYDFASNARTPSDLSERVIAPLRQRGPDGESARGFARTRQGLHEVELAGAPVALLHTRLAMLDLSAAATQPMSNEDGSLWLVCNGEIYNFRELRSELQALGHVFKSRCDVEVILHGYETWGDSVVTRLRGMFAFGLLDTRRDRWLCARDPMGIKPLVYHAQPGRFAFASTLDALRQVPGVDTEVDRQALIQYLALGYIPAPLTIARGAGKLPAGHLLIAEPKKVSVHAYQSLRPTPRNDDPAAAMDALQKKLEQAVEDHLHADVPVGCFLSGGVDSALITTLAARHQRPSCFTMGFGERRFDERREAGRLAGRLGLPWTAQRLEPNALKRQLLGLAHIFDEPFADPSAAPTAALARMARREVKAVLSGDGGDEFFLGYTRYRFFALAQQATAVPKPWRQHAAQLTSLLPAHLLDRGYAGLRRLGRLPSLPHPARKLQAVAEGLSRDDPVALYADTLRIASPRLLSRLIPDAEEVALAPLRRAADGLDITWPQLFASQIDQRCTLPGDILTKVDRCTMAVGLEARVPLLDLDIVALARAIDPRLHVERGGKAMLKGLYERQVREGSAHRPKQGFSIPLASWLRGPLREEVEATSRDGRLGSLGLSMAGVARIGQEHLTRHQDHSPLLWALIMLRHHLDGRGQK